MSSFDALYEGLQEGDPTGQMIALTELNDTISLSNGKHVVCTYSKYSTPNLTLSILDH
jgi:hypothetical protein